MAQRLHLLLTRLKTGFFIPVTGCREKTHIHKIAILALSTLVYSIVPFLSGNAINEQDIAWIKNNFGKTPFGYASSTLQSTEPEGKFDIRYLSDNDEKTAWCTDKGPKDEYIFIAGETQANESYPDMESVRFDLTLKIYNGYGEHPELFQANNRIKKATLRIYEAAIGVSQDSKIGAYIAKGPIFSEELVFEFEDKPIKQSKIIPFQLKMKTKNKEKSGGVQLVGKFIINEVYKGKKYNDTCISELHLYITR